MRRNGPLTNSQIEEIFSSQGALAQQNKDYQPRESQVNLALAINKAISKSQSLIAEAPTGIGKTFAYLVPALLSGKKTVISTGTKNLQDQLYFKDLPKILSPLKLAIKTSLLKGRQNYICLYRLDYNQANALFPNPQTQKDFQYIVDNVTRFTTGDKSDLNEISEDSLAWQYATSSADNCLGKKCPNLNDCYLFKARKQAQQADLVVINHHLFFADCAIKEEGFGEILPDAKVVIFDEAHQISQVASHFFGQRLSSRQMKLLMHDIDEVQQELNQYDKQLVEIVDKLIEKVANFRDSFASPNGRYPLNIFQKQESFNELIEEWIKDVENLYECLSLISDRHIKFESLLKRASDNLDFLRELVSINPNNEMVYWVELFSKSAVIHSTPLMLDKVFKSILLPNTSYIFTSATLSVDGDFEFFKTHTGLKSIETKIYPSPFDYQQQSLMYIPRGLPDPKDENYTIQLTQQVLPVIEQLEGRTFYLFTSFKALNIARDFLKEVAEFNLFIQGEMPKTELLNSFKRSENAVLLGTYSFWEGVDVKGRALSCVIVDKLPFESPFDPVLQAKIQYLKEQSIEPFNNYQLPLAIIALKQGLGRLIRDHADQGILILGDPRLSAQSYGAAFLHSLPTMSITREPKLVLEFAKNLT